MKANGSNLRDWYGTMMCYAMVGLSAAFGLLVARADIQIENVRAEHAWPWDTKKGVGLTFTVLGEIPDGASACMPCVTMIDKISGQTYSVTNITGDTELKLGKHHIWCDVSNLGIHSERVSFSVMYALPYIVIDLSAGTLTPSYPVTGLMSVPSGGWSDEYKRSKLVMRRIDYGSFGTNSFYIGAFEVTQRQWELVMGSRPSYFSNDACYAARPVEQVTYAMIRKWLGSQWPNTKEEDENTFLGVLRAKTGLGFDLPTTAQWEYACRAGTTTDLNNGSNLVNPYDDDSNMDKVGRYYYNGGSSNSQDVDLLGGTAQVGTYEPNAWGLYDMHGNVEEWCLDGKYIGYVYNGTYQRIQECRGGSWKTYASDCRSSSMASASPTMAASSRGFRLVRILPSSMK